MSPADRQAEAAEDVERIARALYSEILKIAAHVPQWDGLNDIEREMYRTIVRRLLLQDVIRVGARPSVERPMEGQTSIDDETGHLTDEDKAVGADGK